MLIKPSIYPWSGYFGYLKQPHDKKEDTSVFVVCDKQRTELNLFLLQPGSYNTAFEIARGVHFQEVNIFATAYDINFVTDVYRLSHDLKMYLKKPVVHTYFPEVFPMAVDPTTSLNHIRKFTFKSHYDPNISVEYHIHDRSIDDRVKAGLMNLPSGLLYDIVVFLGGKVVILPAKATMDILNEAVCIDKAEVHLPYKQTLYGGYSYSDITEDCHNQFSRYIKRICYVNCFSSIDEMIYCRNQGSIQIAEYLHNSLL